MSEMPHGPGRQEQRQEASKLLRAQVLREAGGPASAQLLILVQPHPSFLMQELSDFRDSGCNHPLPILTSDVLSKRTCALCFRGPSLLDWGRSSRSLPPLNHLSLECQDCHSCSTGPFLETKRRAQEKCVRSDVRHPNGPLRAHNSTCKVGIRISCIRLGANLVLWLSPQSCHSFWTCLPNNSATPISRSPVPFSRPGKF